MLASRLTAVDAFVIAIEDVLTGAVADGVELAALLDCGRSVAGMVNRIFAGIAAVATNRAANRVRTRTASSVIVCRLTICEKNRILGRSTRNLFHAKTVIGQRQTGIQVRAAAGSQSSNTILYSLSAIILGDIGPFADRGCICAELDHGHIDLAALVVLHQGVHEALGSRLQVAHLIFHRVGHVDDQHNRCVTGLDSLCGLHLQRNVERILAGLVDGLADCVALIGHRLIHSLDLRGHAVLADGKISVLKDLVLSVREHAGGQQAQDHDQRQQDRQYAFALLCHDSFSFSSQDFENEILGGRAGMAASPL